MAADQNHSPSEALYAGTESIDEIQSRWLQYYAAQALEQIEEDHAGAETEAESTPQDSYEMSIDQDQSQNKASQPATSSDAEIQLPLQPYYVSQAAPHSQTDHATTVSDAELHSPLDQDQLQFQALSNAELQPTLQPYYLSQAPPHSEASHAIAMIDPQLQPPLQPYYLTSAPPQNQADQTRVLTDAEIQSRLEQHYTTAALAHGSTINRQILQYDKTVNTQTHHQQPFSPLPLVMITQQYVPWRTTIQVPTFVVNAPGQDPPTFVHIRIGLPLEAGGAVDNVWVADVKDPDSIVTIKIKHDINGRVWYEISVRNLTNVRTGFQVEVLHVDLVATSQDLSFVRARMLPSFDPRGLPWSYAG